MHHWDISGFSLSLSLSHNRRTIAENHAEKNASIKAPIEDDGMADFGMAAKVANFGTSA